MIQLGRLLIHNLLRNSRRILSPRRPGNPILILLLCRCLTFRLLGEQISDGAFASGTLVDSECGAELVA